MALKHSTFIAFGTILAVLAIIGIFPVPVAGATPTTSYFTGFSGFIDYGYTTTVPSIVISPSFSSTAFQEYDIKYGYNVPPATNNVRNNSPGNTGSFDSLFTKAMVNYHLNPPKPITNPSPDFTFRNLNSVYISIT